MNDGLTDRIHLPSYFSGFRVPCQPSGDHLDSEFHPIYDFRMFRTVLSVSKDFFKYL